MAILTVFELTETHLRVLSVEQTPKGLEPRVYLSESVACLKNGLITHPLSFLEVLKKVRDALDGQLVRPVESVVLCVSGLKTHSSLHRFQTDFLSARPVMRSDLIELISQHSDSNSYVLHCLPIRYKVDNRMDVENPEGLIASHLTMAFHVVSIPFSDYVLYEDLFKKVGLKIDQVVSPAFVLSQSLLSDQRKKDGSILIDFGRDFCQLAVWVNRSPFLLSSFPLGANLVTKDVAAGFRISLEEAADIKEKYARAWILSEDHLKSFEVQGRTRSLLDLTHIVHTRTKEIFELLRAYLLNKTQMDVVREIVLTGGGARTPYLKELVENIFHRPVSVLPEKSLKGHILSSVLYSAVLFKAAQTQFSPAVLKEKERVVKTLRSLIQEYL